MESVDLPPEEEGSEKEGSSEQQDEDNEPEEPVKKKAKFQEDPEEDIKFEILVGGSIRGRCKLKDSRGYTYTLKNRIGNKTWWRCSKRSKTLSCSSSVIQIGDEFQLGRYPHEHPPFVERASREGVQYRKPAWLKKETDDDLETSLQDESDGIYICSPLDDNIDDQNSEGGKESQPSLVMKFSQQQKKGKEPEDTERSIQSQLIRIEQERLSIEKQRLAIEKQRLLIDKELLEETKKHNKQCQCMKPAENLPLNVLLQKNF